MAVHVIRKKTHPVSRIRFELRKEVVIVSESTENNLEPQLNS